MSAGDKAMLIGILINFAFAGFNLYNAWRNIEAANLNAAHADENVRNAIKNTECARMNKEIADLLKHADVRNF